MNDIQTIEYVDPRSLSGTPYEVAKAAADQAKKVAELLSDAVHHLFLMARSAQMERELTLEDACDGAGFANSPLGERILTLGANSKAIAGAIHGVGIAAGYDPRHPPKEMK